MAERADCNILQVYVINLLLSQYLLFVLFVFFCFLFFFVFLLIFALFWSGMEDQQLSELEACNTQYPYSEKLLSLAKCIPLTPSQHLEQLAGITSPFCWQSWQFALRSHPDKKFANYIVEGIKEGFRVGFNYQAGIDLKPKQRNIASAYQHPNIVSEYLQQECQAGRILGPFARPPAVPFHME